MEAKWFAGRLKELRRQAELTQQELSERSGVSKAGIADLEQGRREPTWATVIALAQALGVDCRAFLEQPAAEPRARRGRPRREREEEPRRATPPSSPRPGKPKWRQDPGQGRRS
jgi:transcriptional regulator with XRE-family HTH domain